MARTVWAFGLRLESCPRAIRAARRLLRAAAQLEGADDLTAAEIEVAVGEALTNAHVHAYEGGIGPVEIGLRFDGARLEVQVRDRGSPIAPVRVPTALGQEMNAGRGLFLISRLMDGVEITQSRGTALRMVKRLRQERSAVRESWSMSRSRSSSAASRRNPRRMRNASRPSGVS